MWQLGRLGLVVDRLADGYTLGELEIVVNSEDLVWWYVFGVKLPLQISFFVSRSCPYVLNPQIVRKTRWWCGTMLQVWRTGSGCDYTSKEVWKGCGRRADEEISIESSYPITAYIFFMTMSLKGWRCQGGDWPDGRKAGPQKTADRQTWSLPQVQAT